MFGKDKALEHWCMTPSTYVGYSCFETEKAFRAKGRVGSTPKLGALVIFKRSHMGRVLSINNANKTFECGEGNTSNKQYDRNGDSCAVKTYFWNDSGIQSFCYINYEDNMLPSQIVSASKAVYEMAHNLHFKYGDSKSLPPCDDHIISCDRLAARALWDLGYQNQPRGGITVMNMEQYLLSWGFQKIGPGKGLKAGDIVLMKAIGQVRPTAAWHVYVVVNVYVENGVTYVDKYDMGSQQRINSAQPFKHCLVNEWPNREFYCAFRVKSSEPSKPTEYTFTPKDVKAGSTGASQYLATEILKAYDIKACNKNGKAQDLELNDRWTNGDMCAMCQWKLDRLRQNGVNLTKGPYGAGEIGAKDWESLLSSGLPFKAKELPSKETHGSSVLLVQRILRANGYKGADSKDIALDADWGTNTSFAVKAWQSKAGRSQTGKMTYDDWKVILRNI